MYLCPDCGGELEEYGHFTITNKHWCPKCECPQILKDGKWISAEIRKDEDKKLRREFDRSWKT